MLVVVQFLRAVQGMEGRASDEARNSTAGLAISNQINANQQGLPKLSTPNFCGRVSTAVIAHINGRSLYNGPLELFEGRC